MLIILTFSDWFSARTSGKLPITFACFAVEEVCSLPNRFPSKPWQDYLFWFKVQWVMKV